MSLDAYISLGRSGLRVSPFGLGTMTFGEDWGWGATPDESEAMLSEYLDRGGNLIDTANIYTNGHSEKIIGDYFAHRAGRRARVVISTKFFGNLFAGDPNGGGAGRKAMIAQCEESLRRLQTDYIDIYWLHNWDSVAPIDETMRALDDLVATGKIRYIGLSDLPAWKATHAQLIANFRGWVPAIALQLEYSLLERTVEGELIPMAQELGLGVMPWSPLKNGWLSGKFSKTRTGPVDAGRTALVGMPSERDYAVIDALDAVAADLHASPAAVALAWVQHRPGVASTLIGARRLDQLRMNLSALDLVLTTEHIESLNTVSTPALNFPAHYLAHWAPHLAFAGAMVDGVKTMAVPMLTQNPARY